MSEHKKFRQTITINFAELSVEDGFEFVNNVIDEIGTRPEVSSIEVEDLEEYTTQAKES